MPDKYVNTIIDRDTFLTKNVMGDFYTGFVRGAGYAFTDSIFPYFSSGSGTDSFYPIATIQRLDLSDEARVRSLGLTDETLKEKIMHRNADGTYTIAIAGEMFNVLSPDNVYVHIDDTGPSLMAELKIKKVKIGENKTEISTYSTNFEVKNAPAIFSIQPEMFTPLEYVEGFNRAFDLCGVPVAYASEVWGLEKTTYTNKKLAQRWSYKLHQSLKNNDIHIQTRTLKNEVIPKGLKYINRGLNTAGVALTALDIYYSQQLRASHIVSLFMISSIFPVSWVFAGTLIIGDAILRVATDKSLMDWIDVGAGLMGIGDENGVIWKNEDGLISREEKKYRAAPRKHTNNFIIEQDHTRVVRPIIPDIYEHY